MCCLNERTGIDRCAEILSPEPVILFLAEILSAKGFSSKLHDIISRKTAKLRLNIDKKSTKLRLPEINHTFKTVVCQV